MMDATVRAQEPLCDAGEFVVECHSYKGKTYPHSGPQRVHERIVRCRDCVHSFVSFDETRTICRYWSMNDYDDSESSHVYTLYPVVKPDGFCAWGVRKED